MTFAEVLKQNHFETSWNLRYGDQKSDGYSLIDGDGRATITETASGSQLSVCLQTGPASFFYVGSWQDPEIAAAELPAALRAAIQKA